MLGPNDRLPHGTVAALRDHLAHGEPACEQCALLQGLALSLRVDAALVVEAPTVTPRRPRVERRE